MLPAKPNEPVEYSDPKYLVLALHYEHMKQFGHDFPMPAWMINNGHHLDILPPGHEPYDWFADYGTDGR